MARRLMQRFGRAAGRQSRRAQRDEDGMVILLFSLSFMALLSFLIIVADAGLVFMEKRSLQNVADASALAGARELYLSGAAAGEAEAMAFAAKSDPDLVSNTARAVPGPNEVTSKVSDSAAGLLGGSPGFGEPEVFASATARIGAPILAGPGVFCVGVYAGLLEDERTKHAGLLATGGYSHIWDVPYDDGFGGGIVSGDYHIILRYGSASGSPSNAGYLDIGAEGGANQAVRQCFEEGSQQRLTPREPTQGGVAAGPSADGLQARLEDARDRSCFEWDDIAASILAADGPDRDGVLEEEWTCSPLTSQDTAVVLVPITVQDFTSISGGTMVDIYRNGQTQQYQLAYFWVDAEQTFENVNVNQWKFAGGAQGQGEIEGVFITSYLTELTPQASSGSGSVPCVIGESIGCFLQLID